MMQSVCPECGVVMGTAAGAGPGPCPHCFALDGSVVALDSTTDGAISTDPRHGRDGAGSRQPSFEFTATEQTWRESGPFALRSRLDIDSTYVVELFGELDMGAAVVLAEELERAELSSAEQIVVDLSGLDFIDFSGFRALGNAYSSCARRDPGRLVFLRGEGAVDHFLKATGLEATIPFAD